MTWTILSYLVWISYIIIDGLREANFRHSKKKNVKVEMEIFKICNLQRLFVLSMISFFIISNIGWFGLGVVLSLILITPFFLNASYFTLRNKLNPNIYKQKVTENLIENDEQPSIYLDFKLRSKLALIGLILQFFTCFLR